MQFQKQLLIGVMLGIIFYGCKTSTESSPAYEKEINEWHQQRVENLKTPDGWLSLAGLFFLEEGENTFGSGADQDMVFPEKAPAQMGVIRLEEGQMELKVADGVAIEVNGKTAVEEQVIANSTDHPFLMTWESLTWFVMQRGDRFMIRLRDAKNKAIESLMEIDRYDIDPNWNLQARLVRYEGSQKVTMKNQLGMDISMDSEGYLEFEIGKETFQLVTLDGGPEEYFIIFADETTGGETYGGGRYLYVPKANAEGTTQIDFNKAYNPPCVFTDYATCLLPPVENQLQVAILAGEKNYGDH